MINTVGKTQLVLTVFYECLCPDSKSFFIKHLLPSIVKVPQFISAVLVPYGKAKTIMRQGEYRFTCQHGEVECFGNKIHACVIAKVQDVLIQVQIITCMIADNIDPKEIGRKCCESHDVDWLPIQACALGIEGDALLKQHGDKTNSLVPRVTFIPTVLINGNRGNQAAILKNLWKELCREVCMWHPPSTKYIDVVGIAL
ncbi:hypothetical protein AAG570_013272 [Ranatra chinensis]|uniref:Gamma-interferon-inducible lysosomal thiol reductase n=1 Tax=Ranatra chinensis TaxID=642074 RepID=A0ABD0Z4K9_9HEMI